MGAVGTSNFDRVVEVQQYAWCPLCGEETDERLAAESIRGWAIWHLASNPPGHEVRIVNHTVRLYNAENVTPEQMEREYVRRNKPPRRRATKVA